MLALVVPAAGASRRLGECKALVDLAGVRAIDRLLVAGSALGDPRPLVVTGAHHEAIARALEGRGVELLEHRAWDSGRTGGLAAAAAARPGADLCIAPVDHPLVSFGTFTALAAEWEASGAPGRGWLAPRHGDRHGHPVVLGRDLAAGLGSVGPDTPLRALREGAQPLLGVAVEDPGVLLDLDTQADLENLRRAAGDPASDALP